MGRHCPLLSARHVDYAGRDSTAQTLSERTLVFHGCFWVDQKLQVESLISTRLLDQVDTLFLVARVVLRRLMAIPSSSFFTNVETLWQ